MSPKAMSATVSKVGAVCLAALQYQLPVLHHFDVSQWIAIHDDQVNEFPHLYRLQDVPQPQDLAAIFVPASRTCIAGIPASRMSWNSYA